MDIRRTILAILVGGSPAPGVNAVISAVAIEALHNDIEVTGILHGWKHIKKGQYEKCIRNLTLRDVSSLHPQPGSFLHTSFDQLHTPKEVDNVLRVMIHLRIRHLVTIGGIETAYSSFLLMKASKEFGYPLTICHVPKTVFNDLPLPRECKTFGYSTARDYGVQLLNNLRVDAKTLGRWYIVTLMGQRAGHLANGIAKGAASTVTLIPEDYEDAGEVDLKTLTDTIEASMLKRLARNRDYGIAVVTQGLVRLMKEEEVSRLFGSIENGYLELSSKISSELRRRMSSRGTNISIFSRFIGSELRSAAPNATDLSLARDLGYCATRQLLDGGNGLMVALKGGVVSFICMTEMLDDKTGVLAVRTVDRTTLSFDVGRKYQTRLTKEDLQDPIELSKLAAAAQMTDEEFCKTFAHVAVESTVAKP